jgi:hypothetical protein
MNPYQIRGQLLLGLQNVTLETGNPLSAFLSDRDMKDIANTLSHFIPKGTQDNMVSLQYELLSKVQGNGPTTNRLFHSEDAGILIEDTVKTLKHKMFVMMYILYLHGENLDDTINEMFNFYNSFVIDKNDIREEVSTIQNTNAMTVNINDMEVVRLDRDTGKFVPTTRTLENFKNLL